MASIGESVFCHGGQLEGGGKAQIEEGGFENIQTQCPGDIENRKSSWT